MLVDSLCEWNGRPASVGCAMCFSSVSRPFAALRAWKSHIRDRTVRVVDKYIKSGDARVVLWHHRSRVVSIADDLILMCHASRLASHTRRYSLTVWGVETDYTTSGTTRERRDSDASAAQTYA
jgi:hypothetical protein